MVWVQAFPTGPTLISQSVTQFQDNWLFLQNSINTDHFFNSGAPNEGHHRFTQTVNQVADPAVAVDSVSYTKLINAKTQPFFRNSNNVYRVPFGQAGTTAVGAAGGPRTVNVLTFPAISGVFTVMANVNGAENEGFACSVFCDGVNLFPFALASPSILLFTALGTPVGLVFTVITTKANAFTFNWYYWGMQL